MAFLKGCHQLSSVQRDNTYYSITLYLRKEDEIKVMGLVNPESLGYPLLLS